MNTCVTAWRSGAKRFSTVLGLIALCLAVAPRVGARVLTSHSKTAQAQTAARKRKSEFHEPSSLFRLHAHRSRGSFQTRSALPKPISGNGETRTMIEGFVAEATRLQSLQIAESSKQALEKFKAAADLSRTVGDWQGVAYAMRNAGEISQLLSNPNEAFSSYEAALIASRKGKNRLEEGWILNDVGYLNFLVGNTVQAKTNCSRALEIGEILRAFDLQAQALVNLGYCFYTSGDLVRSTEYELRALALLSNVNDDSAHSKALVCLGYDYLNLGEPQKAKESQRAALDVAGQSQNLMAQSQSLIALANLEAKLGERQDAITHYNRARDLVRQIGAANIEATVLGGLGYVSFSLGEKEKALAYDQESLKLFETTNDQWGVAEASLDLGRIYHSLADEPAALDHYRQALSIFNAIAMPRLAAQTLRDMGLAYVSEGESDRAVTAYLQAIHQMRSGQDQREKAYTMIYLGDVHADLGKPEKAIEYYQEALKLSRAAADPGGESLILYKLARAESARGHLSDAKVNLEAAIALIESLRVKVASQDSRAAYFASTHEYYERYADILMQMHGSSAADDFETAAFEASEKARSRSLLESLAETGTNIHEGVDPALLDQERLLEQSLNVKAEREMRLTANKQTEEAKSVAQEVDRLIMQCEELRGQIQAKSPHYAALTQPLPLTLADIQQHVLDDDSLLLEYLLTEERSYVWAVTRNEISAYELPPRKIIDEATQRLHTLLTAGQPVGGETFEDRELRMTQANARLAGEVAAFSKLVLGPVAAKLGKKRLLIVPDGALQYIPFQVLTEPAAAKGDKTAKEIEVDANQVPLIVNHEIINEPSASALALVISDTAQRRRGSKSIAVFANPVFEPDDSRVAANPDRPLPTSLAKYDASDSKSQIQEVFRDAGLGDGLRIPSLPASREEAEAIMSIVPWRSGLQAMDFNASRATVAATDLGQYRIVHFATHGFVDYQHPELSGLVLSLVDKKGEPQDGFLRMHDIYNLKLPVDLVVLSACNTGLGKDVKGEGLIGLTRGFMYAGAASVAASLWKVDDEATAELMKRFYEGMFHKDLSPAAALRQAQIGMWQQKRWHEPYYWAAFVLQGQYDQKEMLTSRRRAWQIVTVVGVISILAAIVFLFLRRKRQKQTA
jgi:CHAT domain-containing protein/Tfp pilus assembly protein PilF